MMCVHIIYTYICICTHIRFPATVRSMHMTEASSGETARVYVHTYVNLHILYSNISNRFISFERITIWRNETSRCTWCLSSQTTQDIIVPRDFRYKYIYIYIHTYTHTYTPIYRRCSCANLAGAFFSAKKSYPFVYWSCSKWSAKSDSRSAPKSKIDRRLGTTFSDNCKRL